MICWANGEPIGFRGLWRLPRVTAGLRIAAAAAGAGFADVAILRYDWRGILQGPWAGSMQNNHPQLGGGRRSFDVLPGTLATAAAVVVRPDRRSCFDGDRALVTGVQVA